MTDDHRIVGDLLKQARKLTLDYTAPADACASYHALYQALEALEADLIGHIHLENNVLFPRAKSLAGNL
jgi:regulator of cell morphogenesis and NO signaling